MPIANAFIFEFLYRGRAPGDPEPPAYHLILGVMKAPPFSDAAVLETSDTMNVEQATALGYSLAEILSEINADMLAHNDAQATSISDLTAQLEMANEALQTATATATGQASQIEILNAQIAQAKSDADEQAKQITDLTAQVAALTDKINQPVAESA